MDNKRKVIVLVSVRGEEDNLKRLIPVWQQFCDHIVVAYQHSHDKTREVLSQFPDVIVVDNQDTGFHEGRRNVILINKAREITSGGILIFLDADETLSANILYSPEWMTFCNEEAGTTGIFRWIHLWKTPFKYLDVSSGNFAFIDDGREVDNDIVIHGIRGSLKGNFKKKFIFNDIINLHLYFLNFEIAKRKNNMYKAWYITRGDKSYFKANLNHNWFYYVKEKELRSTPREWLQGYIDKGLDLTSSVVPDLLWYEVEILRWFNKYGVKKFYFSDIWRGVDWEEKRKLALARGISGIPATPIKKPNRLILFYNGLGTYNVSWRDWFVWIRNRLLRVFLP